MKLNEFKAWFDGYTESMDGPPNKKQWARIQEQVKAIDGTPVRYPVYIDRYVRPYWDRYYAYSSGLTAGTTGDLRAYSTNQIGGPTPERDAEFSARAKSFDSVSAMYAASKAEALKEAV